MGGESSKDAFMRRLKKADPAYEIYEAYAAEHTERWAGAKALSMADAMAEMPEVERKYNLECAEYDSVLFGLNDELTAAGKVDQDAILKLADVGKLQAQLDSAEYVAVKDGQIVTKAEDLTESIKSFDASKD